MKLDPNTLNKALEWIGAGIALRVGFGLAGWAIEALHLADKLGLR